MTKPFLDRSLLIEEIQSFTRQYNAYFKQQESRMSDFFEMAAYNEIVRYYKKKKYEIYPCNLKNGVFKYRLVTSGLKENFSYFLCKNTFGKDVDQDALSVEIHHNLRMESASSQNLYYNADISVCFEGMVVHRKENSRQIDYIENRNVISFFEIKNLNPFPEVLFNFSGLLLEFKPQFIHGQVHVREFDPDSPVNKMHLCPGILFSGIPNQKAREVSFVLKDRYKHNIICGLANNRGKMSLWGLKEYDPLGTVA